MKSKAKSKDPKETLEDTVKKLLELMGTHASSEITFDKETDSFRVDIKTDDEAGLLIGAKGETINSLQTILALILRQNTGEWRRVTVNVADWIEKQEGRLKELAQQAARRAKETGQPQNLYNLNSSQRRTIHLYLSEDKEVVTESEGEGGERFLIVKPSKIND